MSTKNPSPNSYAYRKYRDVPPGDVPAIRKKKMRQDKFLTIDEIQLLLEVVKNSDKEMKERDYALLYLTPNLGLRASEVVRFSVEDTLFRLEDTCCINLLVSKRREGNYKVMTKADRLRSCKIEGCQEHVKTRGLCKKHYAQWLRGRRYQGAREEYPVTEEVRGFLLEYADNLPKIPGRKTWFFPSDMSRRGHITTRQAERIFDLYVRMAGLSKYKSFHALRHSLGVMVQEQFGDINITKKILRHKSISSTQIYVELTDEGARKVLEGLPSLRRKENSSG